MAYVILAAAPSDWSTFSYTLHYVREFCDWSAVRRCFSRAWKDRFSLSHTNKHASTHSRHTDRMDFMKRTHTHNQYQTKKEEKWNETAVWPPKEMINKRLHDFDPIKTRNDFGAKKSLPPSPPPLSRKIINMSSIDRTRVANINTEYLKRYILVSVAAGQPIHWNKCDRLDNGYK